MNKTKQYSQFTLLWLCILIIVECVSLIVFEIRTLQPFVYVLIISIVAGLTFWRFEYGVYALLGELAIGGKGYLLWLPVGNFDISIRIGLFIVVCIVFLVALLRKRLTIQWQDPLVKSVVLLSLVVAVAIVVGYFRGNIPANIFYDANGYLYLLLGIPMSVICTRPHVLRRILAVLFAGILLHSLKTLFVLGYFSHVPSEDALRTVYKWIRDTGVGEMTNLGQGFYRVFFQSHLLTLVAGVALLPFAIWPKHLSTLKHFSKRWLLVALNICGMVLLISFSRSFWLAAGVTIIVLGVVYLMKRGVLNLMKVSGMLILFLALQVSMITLIVNFPLPGGGGGSSSPVTLLRDRVSDGGEAALSSRMGLLKPLIRRIGDHPVIGSGLGATVSYATKDPRLLAETGGLYTTYALEWGYGDLLLKFGVLGTAAVLFILMQLLRSLFLHFKKSGSSDLLSLAALLGVVAVLATHVTTPYLNHPIGIGALLVISVLVINRKSIDEPSPIQ